MGYIERLKKSLNKLSYRNRYVFAGEENIFISGVLGLFFSSAINPYRVYFCSPLGGKA